MSVLICVVNCTLLLYIGFPFALLMAELTAALIFIPFAIH